MSPRDELDQLEKILLGLGTMELAAETSLQTLLVECRKLGMAGDNAGADHVWDRYQRTRKNLASLRERIRAIEAQLYGARRQQRL